MSWSTEGGAHEGWLDGMVADGRSVASYGPNGVITLDDGTTMQESGAVVSWRLTCSCGWLSITRYRDDSQASEEAAHAEWGMHVDMATRAVREKLRVAAEAERQARKALDEVVREAAEAGVSQSTIQGLIK